MTQEFDDAVLDAFLKGQGRLFPEPVAETAEEAKEFLTDSMAVVVESLEEAMDYLDELGMDISNMDEKEIAEAEELLPIGDGRYLVMDV